MVEHYIGFDLGGTKMIAGVLNQNNKVLSKVKRKTQTHEGYRVIFNDIITCIKDALTEANLSIVDINAIGMAVPGIFDRKDGILVLAPNLGFTNFPLKSHLSKYFNVPIYLENDVNAGVWGEWIAGAAQGYKHVLGVYPGTGIGGGLIFNGELYIGASGHAGELGHMTIQIEGPLCGCGKRGHIEAIASRTAMNKEAAGLIANGTLTGDYTKGKTDIKNISSKFFLEGLKKSNQKVKDTIDHAAHFLGIHLGSCINLLNPELVLIGGGLIEKLGDYYLKNVEKAMRESALASVAQHTQIKAADLGDCGALIGSAALARQALQNQFRQ